MVASIIMETISSLILDAGEIMSMVSQKMLCKKTMTIGGKECDRFSAKSAEECTSLFLELKEGLIQMHTNARIAAI